MADRSWVLHAKGEPPPMFFVKPAGQTWMGQVAKQEATHQPETSLRSGSELKKEREKQRTTNSVQGNGSVSSRPKEMYVEKFILLKASLSHLVRPPVR